MVIYTLMSSLLVHKMSVLPLMPKCYQDQIYAVFHRYNLWKGKRAKLSMRLLQNTKEQGGLRRVHLDSRETVLKIAWVFRAMNKEFISTVMYNCLWPRLREMVWEVKLSGKDIKAILAILEGCIVILE